MSSILDPSLLQEVMRLPDAHRSKLVALLLESLEDGETPATPEEVKAAWVAELDFRAAEADSGAVSGLPFDQAWREIAGPNR